MKSSDRIGKAHLLEGRAHRTAQRYEEAWAHYKKALKKCKEAPDKLEAAWGAVECLKRLERWGEVLEVCNAAKNIAVGIRAQEVK